MTKTERAEKILECQLNDIGYSANEQLLTGEPEWKIGKMVVKAILNAMIELYDSELLKTDSEIRQAIINQSSVDGICVISECRINQLLEGAVWYREYLKNK